MSRIILLDVNGILACKIPKDMEVEGPFVISQNYKFVARPGIKEFLYQLKEKYALGIFSSTSYTNITKILYMIDPDYNNLFSFVMDRALTTLDPDYGQEGIQSFDTVKLLSSFWNNAMHNRERKWNAQNTLLVDDDARKMRFNDAKNCLVVKACKMDEDGDQLPLLRELIEAKMEAL